MVTCTFPAGWSFLTAAPAYSAFAGILAGFLFLGIITLMSERSHKRNPPNDARTSDPQTAHHAISRENALALFLPALLSLLIASFLFGEVSGEQVCARGYTEGIFAASLLAIGAIGVFVGIGWMFDVYTSSNSGLRQTANVFIFISFFIVIALLADSGLDIIDNAFRNNPPWYANGAIIAYGPLLLVAVSIVRLWFMPSPAKRGQARLATVYVPAAYVIILIILYSFLTSFPPNSWPTNSLNDWKTYLALSVALSVPGINVVMFARAVPGQNAWTDIVNWHSQRQEHHKKRADKKGGNQTSPDLDRRGLWRIRRRTAAR